MKKVFSLIMVLSLVLCMATTAFAATTGSGTSSMDPLVSDNMEPLTATLPASEGENQGILCVSFPAEAAGYTVTITCSNASAGAYGINAWPLVECDENGTAVTTFNYNPYFGGGYIEVYNNTEGALELTFTLTPPPVGTFNNKDVITLDAYGYADLAPTIDAIGSGEYYYTWTAEADGVFTVSNASCTTVGVDFWNVTITDADWNEASLLDDNWMPTKESASVNVKAGDTLTICVVAREQDYPAEAETAVVSFQASFALKAGTETNPIRIESAYDLTGIDAEPGETYYAISSWLAGKELFIVADENLKFYLNGAELVPVDGMIYAEIVPAGPGGAQLKVVNETDAEIETMAGIQDPLGSEGNPYQINSEYDMTGIDAAPGETWYRINAMLCGKELVIVDDENLTFYLNGVELEVVDGVITTEITFGGPFGALLKVVNETDAEVETMASIQDPVGTAGNPIVITPAVGETEETAAAGTTTHYLIPAMLNGNYIVIEGEGLVVTVNGTVITAVNGTYVAELTGVPTNAIIVENAGDAQVSYTVSITSDNPGTGDMIAAALVLMLTSGAALVGLKKKEN